MKNSITPYLFGESPIRVVEKDGEPWFVASDVCAILAISNPSQAIKGNKKAGSAGLDEDEADVYNLYIRSENGVEQAREVIIVNESGLYALIFKSRKPEARRFRKWVTSEVLPAIRRTGSYGSHQQAYLALIKDQISLGVSPDLAAKNALQLSPNRRELKVTGSLETTADPQQNGEFEELLVMLADGVEACMREFTMDEVIEIARKLGILKDYVGTLRGPRLDRAARIRFGRKLAEWRGRPLRRSDGSVFEIGKRDGRGGSVYPCRVEGQ